MKGASHRRPHSVRSHLYEMSGIGKSIETETRLVVSKGLGSGEGIGSDCLMSTESTCMVMENVLKL